MKLNNHNPIRGYIQENYELQILRTMTSINNIQTALEIGCGNGNGTKLIKKYFSPRNIIAIDLDEKMIGIRLRASTALVRWVQCFCSRPL